MTYQEFKEAVIRYAGETGSRIMSYIIRKASLLPLRFIRKK